MFLMTPENAESTHNPEWWWGGRKVMSAFIVRRHNGHNVPRRWKWSGRVEKWVESQRNKWRGRVRHCCRCIWAGAGTGAKCREPRHFFCSVLDIVLRCCWCCSCFSDSGYQTTRQSLYNIWYLLCSQLGCVDRYNCIKNVSWCTGQFLFFSFMQWLFLAANVLACTWCWTVCGYQWVLLTARIEPNMSRYQLLVLIHLRV